MTHWSLRYLLRLCIRIIGWSYWLPLRAAAANPEICQLKVLKRILKQNQLTSFGEAHSFTHTKNTLDYRTQTPVQTYETLQAAIETQRDTQQPALTMESPILYAQTSGTTGEPKYIPITASALNDYKKQQRIVSYHFYKQCPQAFDGDVLAIVSPAVEGNFDSGVAYGSASGAIHNAMPRVVREKYVVPSSVFDIKNYEIKYQLILCFALARPNISYIACANPSTIVRLLTLARQQLPRFIECIESGDWFSCLDIEAKQISDIQAQYIANPERAAQLRQLLKTGSTALTDFWPNLKLISTWTAGSCGSALSTITDQLPESVTIMDIGYVASELRSSITIDSTSQDGLPLVNNHFYEFVEVDAWDRGEKQTVLLHQIKNDQCYYMIVTTSTGLYRYFMNDIVKVTGFYRNTPLLKFMQKGRGVTSITGEKLYESQVLDAVDDVMQFNKLSAVFIMGLADVNNNQYQLYIETSQSPLHLLPGFAKSLDTAIAQRNMEYEEKRASGRLQNIEVFWLRSGAYEDYKQYCLQQGQREGQFKTIALQYRHEFPYSFEHWIEANR